MQSTWTWTYTSDNLVANVAYDVFTSSTADGSEEFEIMIWLAALGGAGPISSQSSSSDCSVHVGVPLRNSRLLRRRRQRRSCSNSLRRGSKLEIVRGQEQPNDGVLVRRYQHGQRFLRRSHELLKLPDLEPGLQRQPVLAQRWCRDGAVHGQQCGIQDECLQYQR